MQSTVAIFLAIAILIIAMAIFLPWLFRKTIQRDKALQDPNGNPNDGQANATWIGVHKSSDDHDGT